MQYAIFDFISTTTLHTGITKLVARRRKVEVMLIASGSVVKNPLPTQEPQEIQRHSSISGSGGSPGEGNGNPLQYSCQDKPRDRGAWWATVHGIGKSWTHLSDFPFFPFFQS